MRGGKAAGNGGLRLWIFPFYNCRRSWAAGEMRQEKGRGQPEKLGGRAILLECDVFLSVKSKQEQEPLCRILLEMDPHKSSQIGMKIPRGPPGRGGFLNFG